MTPVDLPARHVHFGTVTIRRYQQTLGDHPDCDSGPPITLDWDYLQDGTTTTTTVHDFGQNQEHRFVRRAAGAVTHIRPETRFEILSERGFTPAELRDATPRGGTHSKATKVQ